MPLKTGVDIVHIPRIQRLLENPDVLQRMLHKTELRNMDPQHLAGIIAAKEAFFKAFEMVPKWHEVEIKNKENGKPIMELSSHFQEQVEELDLSISHDEDYAIAQVIIKKR